MNRFILLVALFSGIVLLFSFIGCEGPAGPQGTKGDNGVKGTDGSDGAQVQARVLIL